MRKLNTTTCYGKHYNHSPIDSIFSNRNVAFAISTTTHTHTHERCAIVEPQNYLETQAIYQARNYQTMIVETFNALLNIKSFYWHLSFRLFYIFFFLFFDRTHTQNRLKNFSQFSRILLLFKRLANARTNIKNEWIAALC